MNVEHRVRQPDGSWTCTGHSPPEDRIDLASLDCSLRLADIYDKIKLESQRRQP